MNETIDAGPIIDTQSFPILKTDNAESLCKKSSELGLELLQKSIEPILSGKVRTQEPSKEFYTYKEEDINHEIPSELLQDTEKLYNYVRAMTYASKQNPYIKIGDRKIHLYVIK